MRAAEFNPQLQRPIRKFYKAWNSDPQRTRLNFSLRRKSILAIKIPSRQNSNRAALSRKFNLAIRRKIKPIGAGYALPRAGILFGKDRLPRIKLQPARFVNREILISRRAVIAHRKANRNAAPPDPPRLNLAPADLCLFTSERRLPSRAFKFTPPEADLRSARNKKA